MNASATPETGYPRIDRLLWRAARRVRWARVRAALGLGLLAAALWALGAAWIGKGLGVPGGSWILAFPPLFASLAAALWPAPSPSQTAARLQLKDPALRSALRSAVELRSLGPGEPGRGPSGALIAAHAAATAGALGNVDAAELLPARVARRLLALGAGLALLLAFLAAFGPPRVVAAFATLAGAGRAAVQHADSAREPITGDIELTYLYPAHTRLASRTVSGTDGSITAPAGTQVRLRTRADRDVVAASVVVDGVAGALAVDGKRELSGSILCHKPGSYFFRFQDARGRVVAEGAPIPIALQADAPPQIAIESPAAELEVDPKALVPIRYRADDDYGLSEIALLYRAPGSAQDSRVVVQQTVEGPRHVASEASFDLRTLELAPGDTVSYTLEALDNDAVAGPKSARAGAHTLRIFSEAEHHREAIRKVQEIWERLIALLGDRLDESVARGGGDEAQVANGARTPPAVSNSEADVHALALCDEMEQAAHALLKDPGAPKALPAALANIAHGERNRATATLDARDYASTAAPGRGDPAMRRRILKSALEAEIAELERDVLYLEALLDRQATQDMLALTHELASRRRQLADLLERYRKAPSAQLKAAIEAQIARLQERMAELLSRMGELAKGLSDEHLNRQAMAELSKKHDMAGGLDKVRQLLANGDVEGTLKALDELGSSLDTMQKGLAEAAGEAGQKYPELARQVDALSKDLGKLTEAEKKLAGDTEQVRQRYRKALEKAAPAGPSLLAKLQELVARAKGELDRIPDDALPPGLFGEDPLGTARERTGELGRAIEVRDLDQARVEADQAALGAKEVEGGLEREAESARAYGDTQGPAAAARLDEAHAHAQVALPALEQVRDELRKLFPDQDKLLSPGDRKKMGELSQRQARLRDQLGQVERDVQDVQKSAPLFNPSAGKQLEQARGDMHEAQRDLDGRQPSQAMEREQGAVEQLDGLAQSMKQMAKGGGAGGEQSFPMPFAESEGGGPPDEGQAGEGENAREKVVIPGADQYRVPPEFRRDILDAMRQKAPPQYEDQVKKYYQEIVK